MYLNAASAAECRIHGRCGFLYLTVATLTIVAFLRSSKMRKLPAPRKQRLIQGVVAWLFNRIGSGVCSISSATR